MNAAEAIDHIGETYGPRALALLDRLRDLLIANGWTVSETFNLTDSEYEWSMVGQLPGTDHEEAQVDFRIEVAEARQYDGEPEDGINFGLEAVMFGGRPVGGFTPYNFTSKVWVHANDPDAVEERWLLIENMDLTGFLELSYD